MFSLRSFAFLFTSVLSRFSLLFSLDFAFLLVPLLLRRLLEISYALQLYISVSCANHESAWSLVSVECSFSINVDIKLCMTGMLSAT